MMFENHGGERIVLVNQPASIVKSGTGYDIAINTGTAYQAIFYSKVFPSFTESREDVKLFLSKAIGEK